MACNVCATRVSVQRFAGGPATLLVLAGSLPPSVPDDAYAAHIHLAHSKGVRTILDAGGEPLRLGVEARPYLIKPNVAEAEQLLGRALPDPQTIVEGARELARQGIAVVVISMGAQGVVRAQDDMDG